MFVDFNILNQLGSPSINSNTFANRPAAGQRGRLFVSTDTFEIYRDNGTTWDLIGGPGSSTITGTGTATQVAFFTSSQAIGSNVNLYWDNVNERLGIGTTTPSSKLDIAGSNTLLHLKGGSNAYMMYHGNGIDEYKVGYTDGPVNYRRYSIYDESGAKEVLTIDKQSRYVGINYQYSSLVDQPAYTLDVEGSGRFTNSAYFVSSGSGQVGINTLAPTATALMQADKTDGYGLYLNYTTNAGTGSSATALWSLNTTNGSGYSAVIEEKTPNTTAGQYPLLVKHSLSAGTAGVGMGTGIHFQLPDNAGTFRTTQLTIETTDVAAATYTSRYRFMAQVGGTSTALAYLTSTGLGINGIPTRALELFTNTSSQTAALVLNNAATTPKGYLGTYTNNLYITQGGTFNTSWAADGTNAISAIILGANNNSSTILFQTTNANNSTPLTRMYISEAGNVGINTTGPLFNLDVSGTGRFGYSNNNNNAIVLLDGNVRQSHIGSAFGATFIQNNNYYNGSAYVFDDNTQPNATISLSLGTINFQNSIANVAPSTKMTLDLAGNLGLGVTPSAWSSGFTALQVKNASLWSTGSDASITANAYYDGSNYKYIASSAASRIYHNTDSSISFSQAPSGTAGNNITFTQAMTLNASGSLGIGTANPTGNGWNINSLVVQASQNDTNGALFRASSSNTEFVFSAGNNLAYIATLGADPIDFYTNTSFCARISSAQNFLIGTTTDSGEKLIVNGTNARFYSNGAYNSINIDNGSATGGGACAVFQNNVRVGAIGVEGWWQGTGQDDLAIAADKPNIKFFTNGGSQVKMSLSSGGNLETLGTIKTGAPTTGTAAAWKLGSRVAATVVVNTTEYIEIDIGGTLYKLATVT